MDVDRINYKLTTFDPRTQSVEQFHDINELDKYFSTDEFDWIKVVEDPSFEPPVPGEQVASKKRYSYGSDVNGPDGCTRGVYVASYFLGIRLSKPKPLMVENANGNLVQQQVPCGETYDPTK